MAFSASKKRETKLKGPTVKGRLLIPSAAVESWYRGQMQAITNAMINDYREQVKDALDRSQVKEFFTTDASVSSIFAALFNRMNDKWNRVYAGFAAKVAPEFVKKGEEHADASTLFSLSTMGVQHPTKAYNANVANTLSASVNFNHTLITGIQQEVHEKIHSAVMLSLTSPDPAQQGKTGIQNALKEVGGFSKKRIALIAEDQNSKLYASISDERMLQNGVDEFEWAHSSAGKTPRPSHVAKDGLIFKLNDPRLWEGPKADQGPPGWAIRCRCRKLPVIT